MNTLICDNYNISFVDEFARHEASVLKCYIQVKENKHKTCYVLNYAWVVISGDADVSKNDANPFIHCEEENNDEDGVIVAKKRYDRTYDLSSCYVRL